MWMKTGHAIPPSQADEPAKCHICPQLPLMRRHKRDIELPRRSPAMFVEYQLGLGPAWALFQEPEWEGEAFGCVKNKTLRRTCSQHFFLNQPQLHEKDKPKVTIWLLVVLVSVPCQKLLANRKTQSTGGYPSNVQFYFLFLAWLSTVYKSSFHFHPLQTPNVRLLHCRETNIIWVLFTAYIKDS